MARPATSGAGRGGGGGGGGGRGGGVKKETRTCYFCKQRGHLRAKCPAALAIMGLVQLCRADGTLSAPAGQNVAPRANAGRGAAENAAGLGNAAPEAAQNAPGPTQNGPGLVNAARGPTDASRKALTRRNSV
ncbi:hypothetical protein E8E15_001424 [Penicillium rubens]|uniref:uncharacterized protein n=1 Tax=Penicillium rubens TaxID=1108849 RepID=UPI001D5C1885|nr:uncharacterized protein N7525_010381 [Penicillium rubens]KAF3021170.1 hypothetical protein E8E15_001424 [Penicillium rubens]KAJ5036081.1 hypothetical protein NUH16_003948 [Penicillium rubens]KAJ5821097.1 hypothetical protein N7525_010381 [Penicillium rubens]